MRRRHDFFFAVLILTAFFAGCATTGQDFDYARVAGIMKNQTTKEELLRLLGSPYTKGIENGRDSWTYEFRKTYASGREYHKELVLVFDDRGRVIAFRHESNFPKHE